MRKSWKKNERLFSKKVIKFLRQNGWFVAHFTAAMVQENQIARRWMTPATADGKGFPDLVAIRGLGEIWFIELKTDDGNVKPEQAEWIDRLLGLFCVSVGVLRPYEWEIEKERFV